MVWHLILRLLTFSQVYHQKQQVLIHFNGWRKKFDTVFPMNSKFLRGPTEPDKKAGMKVALIYFGILVTFVTIGGLVVAFKQNVSVRLSKAT